LARGLSALQSDPNVPPQLLELAAQIAQSMGALHQIERSNGTQLVPHANVALENVRSVLARLQQHPPTHPAVNTAMEAVASSLGLVHALSRLAGGGAPAAAPHAQPAPQAAPRPNTAPMAQTVAAPQTAPQAPPGYGAPQGYAPQAAPPQGFPVQHQMPPQQMQPQQMQPQHYAPPQQQYAQPPQQAYAAPMAATVLAPNAGPAPAAAPAGGYARDPFAAGAPAAAPAMAGDKLVVTADLGAQSPTNFYKGLSGNDIVDHGGLFVSTYMIPKIGTPIRLKVALPGGYEFEADAVVRWARDVRDASSDAPPGFGAQFTGITQEARQLVYRYVRNREPLFHDDL
jgi:hypothetical protein